MTNDNFKWTDELIKEMIYHKLPIPNHFIGNVQKCLDDFKATHSSNGERDWEILFFENIAPLDGIDVAGFTLESDGLYHAVIGFPKTLEAILGNKSFAIKTVRRKSDGVVFTVGDVVHWDLSKLPGQSPHPFTITSFEINNYVTTPRMFCNNNNIDICNIQPLPKRTKLFTTEDGVDMFFGDMYCAVDSNFILSSLASADRFSGGNDMYKYFSSKEKAQEYITLNKPLNLSMKEIASCVTNYIGWSGQFTNWSNRPKRTEIDFEKLDELVKSKSGSYQAEYDFYNKEINDRFKQIDDIVDAFNAARLCHPMAGYKYDDVHQYLSDKSKLK